jgi:RpiR family transcriptional regulator, carbohydrate utilization regulator
MNRAEVAKTPQWEVRLRSVYGKLGETERKVADFIRSNSGALLDLSIAEIATSAGVSESSVVRFCRHLGYKGLKEFKIIFAQEKDSPAAIVDGAVEWEDSLADVKTKVFMGSINSLRDSLNLLDDGELAQAIDVLARAKNIDIFGLGGAAPIAAYARHQFMKTGVRTNVYTDAQSLHLSLSQFTKGDVAIAISCSGETKEVVDAMRWARNQGTTIICITNFPESELARIADIRLINTGGRFFRSDINSLSRLAQWATINTLYLGLTLKLGKDLGESLSDRNKQARHFKP